MGPALRSPLCHLRLNGRLTFQTLEQGLKRRDAGADFIRIDSLARSGSQLTVTGANFSATGNQVWFTQATAGAQGWTVGVTHAPAYVNDRCTACEECSKVCPAKVKNPFNLEMDEVPAIRLPHLDAWPHIYTLDRSACPSGCKACVDACTFDAINLDAQETEETAARARRPRIQ